MPEPRVPEVSVRDLLAACAAADAVSRPPQPPEASGEGDAHTVTAANPGPDETPAPHPRAA